MIETLADVRLWRGIPEHIRFDNGPEFMAKPNRFHNPLRTRTHPFLFETRLRELSKSIRSYCLLRSARQSTQLEKVEDESYSDEF